MKSLLADGILLLPKPLIIINNVKIDRTLKIENMKPYKLLGVIMVLLGSSPL